MFARGYIKISSDSEDLVSTNQSMQGLGEELKGKVHDHEKLQGTNSETKLSEETMMAASIDLPVDQPKMRTDPDDYSNITPRTQSSDDPVLTFYYIGERPGNQDTDSEIKLSKETHVNILTEMRTVVDVHQEVPLLASDIHHGAAPTI